MKQTQEFEGKNTDQAIEAACSALNVTRKNLVYDIISSGSSGIFGIVGVKKARIRVTLPKTDRATSGKNQKNTDSNGVMSIVDEAFGEKKNGVPAAVPANDKSAPGNKKSIVKPARKVDKPAKPAKKTQKPERPAEKTQEPAEHVREDSRPDLKADIKDNDPVLNSPVIIENDRNDYSDEIDHKNNTWNQGFPPKYKNEIAVDVSEESIATGKEALQKMVDLITSDATVTAETDHDKLLLKIEGGNSGVLIGRRGQTLEAMQFLCDKIINRKSESRVRLKLDIEGYMETRKANLEALASKMANKAKKTGKPATINQMTAQDRRIVHLALKDDTSVRTQSMGEGYYRRLVIFPKRAASKKNNKIRKKKSNRSQDD